MRTRDFRNSWYLLSGSKRAPTQLMLCEVSGGSPLGTWQPLIVLISLTWSLSFFCLWGSQASLAWALHFYLELFGSCAFLHSATAVSAQAWILLLCSFRELLALTPCSDVCNNAAWSLKLCSGFQLSSLRSWADFVTTWVAQSWNGCVQPSVLGAGTPRTGLGLQPLPRFSIRKCACCFWWCANR